MKKFGKLFLAVFVALFSSITIVNAASKCDYDEQVELNNVAANIKVSYEEAIGVDNSEGSITSDVGVVADNEYTYFKISAFNLTEDVYIKITNDYNNEVKYLYYSDSESGVASYEWKHLDAVTDFTISVYSSNKTGCPNEEYRVIYLTTPRSNWLSDSAACTGNEEFYYCQKYVLEKDEISVEEFEKQISEFSASKLKEEEQKEEEEDKDWLTKVQDFICENKITIIIISTIIVVGGVVTTVIVIKKRRSRLI